jgi:hypothetical protein
VAASSVKKKKREKEAAARRKEKQLSEERRRRSGSGSNMGSNLGSNLGSVGIDGIMDHAGHNINIQVNSARFNGDLNHHSGWIPPADAHIHGHNHAIALHSPLLYTPDHSSQDPRNYMEFGDNVNSGNNRNLGSNGMSNHFDPSTRNAVSCEMPHGQGYLMPPRNLHAGGNRGKKIRRRKMRRKLFSLKSRRKMREIREANFLSGKLF